MNSTAKFAFARDEEKHLDPRQISLLDKAEEQETMEETEVIEDPAEEPTEEADGKLEETPFQTAVLEAYFKGGATPEQIAINMRVDERDIEEILTATPREASKRGTSALPCTTALWTSQWSIQTCR